MDQLVGKPISRVDGRLKVTGEARYAAEFNIANQAYGIIIPSTIAKGRVISIDTTEAEEAPGVLAVMTHGNAPKLHLANSFFFTFIAENRLPLQDDLVHFAGQSIGLIVADTFEHAEYAASLVRVTYDEQTPALEIIGSQLQGSEPNDYLGIPMQVRRGDPAKLASISDDGVKIDRTYTTPVEHHNPMEPSASIAVWDEDRLTIYDSTQSVADTRDALAQIFGIPTENVRVISYFVGGGFGSKSGVWLYKVLAAMAARSLGRPVKVVLSRQQLFSSTGHRPATIQSISRKATKDGKLTAIRHHTVSQGSFVTDFFEACGMATVILYSCPNLEVTHHVVPVNVAPPTFMRAPGEASGLFALESALDELSYELNIDPVKLRIINHADLNPDNSKPWSSKHLKECYQLGMELFGWSKRNPKPRSMRDGQDLVGWGIATGTYPGGRVPASARVRIIEDGSAVVSTATHELGTGTYTILTQIAADTLSLPIDKVKTEIGDSNLPRAPVSGGSLTAPSVGSAVKDAAESALRKLTIMATDDANSPLHGLSKEEIVVNEGRLSARNNSSKAESYVDIIKRNRTPFIEAEANTAPNKGWENYASNSFGAQFAEVKVDPDLGHVRVTRFVGVFDTGRILNTKTARSQMISGIVWGIGMALMEHTVYDKMNGRVITNNMADYAVPVNADVPQIQVSFIDKPDPQISSQGARGVGEIGITGVPAAIANAVYHATGIRVRDLPITPDKLLSINGALH